MNAHQKEFSPRSFRENCTGNRLLILQRRLVIFFFNQSPIDGHLEYFQSFAHYEQCCSEK